MKNLKPYTIRQASLVCERGEEELKCVFVGLFVCLFVFNLNLKIVSLNPSTHTSCSPCFSVYINRYFSDYFTLNFCSQISYPPLIFLQLPFQLTLANHWVLTTSCSGSSTMQGSATIDIVLPNINVLASPSQPPMWLSQGHVTSLGGWTVRSNTSFSPKQFVSSKFAFSSYDNLRVNVRQMVSLQDGGKPTRPTLDFVQARNKPWLG